jgi:DNA-binding CsgD family transcriptional regulator
MVEKRRPADRPFDPEAVVGRLTKGMQNVLRRMGSDLTDQRFIAAFPRTCSAPLATVDEKGSLYLLYRVSVPNWDLLTHRELQVARLVREGLPTKAIALKLGESPRTVAAHLRSISGKLSISSRFELAMLGAGLRAEGLPEVGARQ